MVPGPTHSDCYHELFEANVFWTAYRFDPPARSPDLALCDFFLWGYLKSKVYINRPNTLKNLMNNIEAEIDRITSRMLVRVYEKLRIAKVDICQIQLFKCNLKISLLFNIIKI